MFSLLAILLMVIRSFMLGQYKTVKKVEGLFYEDRSPVTVVIADEKISKVIRKSSLDDPGLSDIFDAVHMASRNPAKLYGLNDRGEIRPGKRADIILF